MNKVSGHADVSKNDESNFHVVTWIKTAFGEVATEQNFNSLESLLGFLSDLKVDTSCVTNSASDTKWSFDFENVGVDVLKRWSKV